MAIYNMNSSKFDPKENNFGLLRFIAASLVIFSHSFYLLDKVELEPFVQLSVFTNIGGVAVLVFFIISGFLLARSWQQNPRVFQFVKNRIIRIFPALLACYFLMIFIFSPFLTSLSLDQYFKDPMTWDYAKNILLFVVPFRFWLPGVFETNVTRFVNGALWTLPIEFFIYMLFVFISYIGIFRYRYGILLTLSLIAVTVVLQRRFGILNNVVILSMQLEHILFFGLSFFIGVSLYTYLSKIPKFTYKLAGIVLFIFVASIRLELTEIAVLVCLPLLIVWFAFAKFPSLVSRLNLLGDYSYGMYIWGWFIQQIIVLFAGKNIPLTANYILCLSLATSAGYLSWNLIEEKALRFKRLNSS